MSITTQIAAPEEAASPISLWHLLSLDAPTVAALWVWFVARSSHIPTPLAMPAAMAIAVWMLYVADRLLDARVLNAEDVRTADELEARHVFHYLHRRTFLVGLAAAAVCLAVLVPGLDPIAVRLYLVEGGLLSIWFVILHATRSAHRLPKEVAIGLFFSAAIFIPPVASKPSLLVSLLPGALLLTATCSLNCLFIFAWEHEGPTAARMAHSTTRLAVAHLRKLTIAIVVGGFAIALLGSTPPRPIAVACALTACLLLALHRNRRAFARNDLRAAADMALLTPILLLPFLR